MADAFYSCEDIDRFLYVNYGLSHFPVICPGGKTFGAFNPAKDLMAKLKSQDEAFDLTAKTGDD